jgi:hypothetical protein
MISGPMAWFIMRNQSQFLFSHDHTVVPCHALLGRSIPSQIVDVGSNAFVLNRIHNYIYQPQELDKVNFYDFLAQFDVKHISKNNEDIYAVFIERSSIPPIARCDQTHKYRYIAFKFSQFSKFIQI